MSEYEAAATKKHFTGQSLYFEKAIWITPQYDTLCTQEKTTVFSIRFVTS